MKNRTVNSKNRLLLLIPAMCFFHFADIHANYADSTIILKLTTGDILFMGYKTYFHLSSDGYPVEELKISASNAEIREDGYGFFILPESTRNITISVQYQGKELLTKEFPVKTIPDPITVLENFDHPGPYEITLHELIATGGIETFMEKPVPPDICYAIVSFFMEALADDGLTYVIKSESGRFSRAQLELLNRLSPGKKVFINSVRAAGPDGLIRDITDIQIRLMPDSR